MSGGRVPVCPTHGGNRYVAGCETCKAYQRDRVARNRAERLETDRLTHGNRSSYDAGCRDACCRAVRRADSRRERAVS